MTVCWFVTYLFLLLISIFLQGLKKKFSKNKTERNMQAEHMVQLHIITDSCLASSVFFFFFILIILE